MARQPPRSPLWQAVQARRPDLWPVDDEVVAADLATALTGVADSLETTRDDTTRAAAMSGAAWADDAGGLMGAGLGGHAGVVDETSAHVRQRAAAARVYATELAGAKDDITGGIEANEAVFASLGGIPAPVGPWAQDVFAGMVAEQLGGAVDRRIATVRAVELPTPPSHEELLARYRQDVDPRPLREYLGKEVTAGEAEAINALTVGQQAALVASTAQAATEGRFAFFGEGRTGDQDNHRDAYRHALWNALITNRIGEEHAATITTLHEQKAPKDPVLDPVREAMDLHNNEVGRAIARANPDAGFERLHELVSQAVRDGKMVVMDDNGRLVPSDQVDFGGGPHRKTTGYY